MQELDAESLPAPSTWMVELSTALTPLKIPAIDPTHLLSQDLHNSSLFSVTPVRYCRVNGITRNPKIQVWWWERGWWWTSVLCCFCPYGIQQSCWKTTSSTLWDTHSIFETQSVREDLPSLHTPVERVGMCALLANKSIPWRSTVSHQISVTGKLTCGSWATGVLEKFILPPPQPWIAKVKLPLWQLNSTC